MKLRIRVVLASRALTGPVFTRTYGYAGAEIELIGRGLVPAGHLSGLEARLLLGLILPSGRAAEAVRAGFVPYR